MHLDTLTFILLGVSITSFIIGMVTKSSKIFFTTLYIQFIIAFLVILLFITMPSIHYIIV